MVDIRETMYMSIQLKDRSLFMQILLMLKIRPQKIPTSKILKILHTT